MNEIKLYTNTMTNYYDEMIAEIKHFRSTHAMTKVIVYDACKVKYPLVHATHQNGNV